MKTNLIPGAILTVLLIISFLVVYPLVMLGIAQLAPNKGKGFTIEHEGKTYYANIAQNFTDPGYFWPRPSAVNYNAAGSGGSNKGPSNPDYLATVQERIDTFLVANPGVQASEIPSDLVTASGSGQDPHISVMAAKVQVKRIAAVRNLPEEKLLQLISDHTEKPALGLFGPEKINVLQLNIALDQIQQ
jgi:K+-transporting ATPase ATPase C chain